MQQKALPITYPHLGKSTLPDLCLISEFPAETVGEPTLDQLHGFFDGHVARQRHQQVQMIWHDDEVMELKFTATFNRSTSMRSIAFRSDCNKRRAMLVFVVAKKTRALLRIAFRQAFGAGCAITGAKSPILPSIVYGPTKVVPRYKTKTQHPKQLLLVNYHTLRP